MPREELTKAELTEIANWIDAATSIIHHTAELLDKTIMTDTHEWKEIKRKLRYVATHTNRGRPPSISTTVELETPANVNRRNAGRSGHHTRVNNTESRDSETT